MGNYQNWSHIKLLDGVEDCMGKILQAETNALKYAYECGRLLMELKKRSEHGGYKQLIEGRFPKSYRTLAVYKKIAENWKSEQVQSGLKDGTITSIKTFLDAIGTKSSKKKFTSQEQQDEYKENVTYLRKTIGDYFEDLEPEEVEELTKNFDDVIWPEIEKLLEQELRKIRSNIKLHKATA